MTSRTDSLFAQAAFLRQVVEPGAVARVEGFAADVEGPGGRLVDPSSARSVVVFPEPLLPRNPKVSSARTPKDRSLMTVLSPESIRKSLMCTSGSAAASPNVMPPT
jgi:hypothetical protein